MKLKGVLLFALGLCAGVAMRDLVASAQPQPAPVAMTRKILQRIDVPDSKYEVVLGSAEIAPDVASIGRHFHDGIEAGVMIEGETVLAVDGATEVDLKPGDSYQIPYGIPHDVRTGASGGKVVAVYVVEKGKPLATAAP